MTATSLTRISSLHQAAVILKSIPKSQAARILSRLQPRDMQHVMEAVDELDRVTADQIFELLEKLEQETGIQSLDHSNAPSTRPPASIQKSNLKRFSGHKFGFLMQASVTVRQAVIQDEHPKNIAMIISQLPPQVATKWMDELEPILRASVLKRLCELDDIDARELHELRYLLKLRFQRLSQPSRGHRNGREKSKTNFQMTDLLACTDAQLKNLLTSVDTTHWAPALKRAPAAVQKTIFRNMASRPAEILCQEIAAIIAIDSVTEKRAVEEIGKSFAKQ